MHELWPLTGRDEESCVIAELIDGHDFRGVLLAGRAGVGKSRLARDAAAAAAASGWSVRHVAATATGRSVPLGAFAQWTDDVEGTPLVLARRVIAALTAGVQTGKRLAGLRGRRTLLDELSALVVHQLVVQGAAVVIATVRNGQPAPDAVTALWKDGLLRRLELQPLSRSESDELLRTALGSPPDRDCADRLWRLTAGNVLFLRQLVEQEQRAGRLVDDRGRCRWLGSPRGVAVARRRRGAPDRRDRRGRCATSSTSSRWPNPWSGTACPCSSTESAIEEAEQRELIRTVGD